MPKLPDIEYATVTQGPPNALEGFGALSQGLLALQEAQNKAMGAYAEELAKTQHSEASLMLEAGLADTEAKLSKPYVTQADVESAFPGGAPPEVRTILQRYRDRNDEAIPTHEVGTFIHAQVSKDLLENARGLIYSPTARAEFERRAAASTLHRSVQVNQAMMAQGAELAAAKSLAIWEQRMNALPTPTDPESTAAWDALRADITSSGLIAPAKKLELVAKVDEAQAARPVFNAIRSDNPALIRQALDYVGNDAAMAPVNAQRRAEYKGRLETALRLVEAEQDRVVRETQRKAGEEAANRLLGLRLRRDKGGSVSPSQVLAALPAPGTVPPETMEHLLVMAEHMNAPTATKVQTNPGVYALVTEAAVSTPEEFARDEIRLPNGQVTSLLALYSAGGLSLEDFKHFQNKRASAMGGGGAGGGGGGGGSTGSGALSKRDTEQVDYLLSQSYQYDLRTENGQIKNTAARAAAGFLYRVVEHELAMEAQNKGGKLGIEDRDAIIRRVLDREIDRRPGILWGQVKNVPGQGVPPDFDVAYHRLRTNGKPLTHQEITATYDEFATKYMRTAESLWNGLGGRPMRAADAAQVSLILSSERESIDAEVLRNGVPPGSKNENYWRARIATARYIDRIGGLPAVRATGAEPVSYMTATQRDTRDTRPVVWPASPLLATGSSGAPSAPAPSGAAPEAAQPAGAPPASPVPAGAAPAAEAGKPAPAPADISALYEEFKRDPEKAGEKIQAAIMSEVEWAKNDAEAYRSGKKKFDRAAAERLSAGDPYMRRVVRAGLADDLAGVGRAILWLHRQFDQGVTNAIPALMAAIRSGSLTAGEDMRMGHESETTRDIRAHVAEQVPPPPKVKVLQHELESLAEDFDEQRYEEPGKATLTLIEMMKVMRALEAETGGAR